MGLLQPHTRVWSGGLRRPCPGGRSLAH
jgi:hypothetical protein